MNLQVLSRNHENFVEQLKHKYGVILFRMLYHNIVAVLRRANLEQLKHKNNKLRILSIKDLKKRGSYQVPIINSLFQVLDTKPLRYRLHQTFTDKNTFFKRNLAVELEALAASLYYYIKQSVIAQPA